MHQESRCCLFIRYTFFCVCPRLAQLQVTVKDICQGPLGTVGTFVAFSLLNKQIRVACPQANTDGKQVTAITVRVNIY